MIMLRIVSTASQTRLFLPLRNQNSRILQTHIQTRKKYGSALERETCPQPPPPPPPPPKDDRLIWGALAAAVSTGFFIVFAKSNPEVRDWLTIHAPWFDDFIAIVCQENVTYVEYAEKVMKYIKNCSNIVMKDKQCVDGQVVPAVVEKPEVTEGPKNQEEDEPDEADAEGHEKEEPSPCAPLPPPSAKDICEMDKCLNDLAENIYFNYMTARDACIVYNKLVIDAMNTFTLKKAKELREAMAERIELVRESLENVQDNTQKMSELSRYLDCGIQAPKSAIDNTRCMLNNHQKNIKDMNVQFIRENDKSLSYDQAWQKIEQVLDTFIEEAQLLFPGLKYDSKKPTLRGDGDLFLHHSTRYIKMLRDELDEAMEGMTDRVNRSLDALPQCDAAKKERNATIDSRYKARKAEVDKEYAKKTQDLIMALDQKTKRALKSQLDRHEELLKQKLKEKEVEAKQKMEKICTEKVGAQKAAFKKELAEMATKLKIVEDKLNAHLKAERESRRSQELWTAGASLLAATRKGESCVNVEKELKAIEKAAGKEDKLVLTLLRAIPASVRDKGLVPESILRQKYHAMEKNALRVALVEQEGAPLPVYILSYIQSMLLFMKLPGIPRAEYDKPGSDPPPYLDTFDLLQRARYWVERGNLAAALRYVNKLEGASRAVADSWLTAAKSHLETRQAAEAVLSHAAAMALQYL